MADYSSASEAENLSLEIRRTLGQMRIALDAEIIAFKPGPPQRCDVQPVTMLKVTLGKEVKFVPLPVLYDVPIVVPFAQTAGLMLTVPLQRGDTVLLLIPDRGLDNFLSSTGGIAPPPVYTEPQYAEPRTHALQDAIAIPGLTRDNKGIPSYSTTNIELRDYSRTNYISLGPDGITLTDGKCVVTLSGGKYTVNAPSGIQEKSGASFNVQADSTASIQATGTVTIDGSNMHLDSSGNFTSVNGTFIDRRGVNLGSHTHPYTDDGNPATTGIPNAG